MTHPLDDTYDEDCETCGERYYDDEREDDIFGECLYPKECVMPGDHMPSECHTAEMYEAAMEEMAAAAGPKPEEEP